MIDWHKRQVNFWKSKLGIGVYGILWVAFVKRILFSLILYHFGIAQMIYENSYTWNTQDIAGYFRVCMKIIR